jgi:ATP-dependent RNA helicase MSS116
MQNILKQNGGPLPRKRYGTPSDIRALIISPTRELAEQIAVEARKICRSADTGIVVQTAVGGTQKSMGLRKIQQEGCHILVGTPGRLKDIFSDPGTGVKAPSLNSLVLDEADRLLDQGFSREIEEIVALLPDRNQVDRQTLLFSATIPREIMSVVRTTMKPDFQFVRTVREDEQPTHERVPQKMVNVGGFENLAPALLELCKREIAIGNAEGKPFKALVYLGATANVHLTASIFDNLRESGSNSFSRNLLYPTALIEIHSRLSQRERTIAADTFRKATSAILFSSDVTARGMDFPNVTHVIQLGVPSTREAYIHRIGRTARADKTGNGWLLHADLEKTILRRRLNDLPLVPDDSLGTAQIDMGARAQLPAPVAENLLQIGEATKAVDRATKASAYMSMLGIYSMIDPRELVEAMNRWSLYGWGLAHPPSIGSGLAKRLGISRVPGVNVSTESHESRGDDFAPRSSSRGAFGTRSSGRGDSYGSPRGASYGGRDYRGSGGGDRAGRPSPRRGGGSGYGDSAPYGRGSGGYGGERRSYPRDQHKAPRRSDY